MVMCSGRRDREELGGGKKGEQRRRRQRPEGGGRTDEDRRVVPRVTVALSCGRKKASEKAATSERILFIVSPKNVYSVLYLAGEEQYSDLLMFFFLVVQRLTVVHEKMKCYNMLC